MKQSIFDLNLSTKRTRKQVFLEQMDTVVPWSTLVEFIVPYYSEGCNGRPPFALETMLRVHFMQQWFSLLDQAMEEALFDTPLYREFSQAKASHKWQVVVCPGKRRELDKENKLSNALVNQAQKIKAGIRVKVEHPFRVIKRQFGFTKVRHRGLKKNTVQFKTLFALSNLWMTRHKLI